MTNRLMQGVRSALLTGGLVLAPLGITLWVFGALVHLADRVVEILPERLQPQYYLGFPIPGLGVVLTLVFVGVVGAAMRYYAGRRVVELYESALGRIPVIRGVYQGVKQLVETLFSRQGMHFRQVVLVEYPRRGLYCVAFLTNERTYVEMNDEGRPADLVSIFLPTTPNPTSGFYLLVPREDLRLLDVSIEEAFKLIMSAGIVLPHGTRVANRLLTPEGSKATSLV